MTSQSLRKLIDYALEKMLELRDKSFQVKSNFQLLLLAKFKSE